MVKVELMYNPFLRETVIRFNGQSPRINSLTEKYRALPLQSWVSNIPQMFYDEMNGYDFELDFSGTKADFIEVEKAFRSAGVTEDQVPVFHRNELQSRDEKLAGLQNLLIWMDQNQIAYHDNERFRRDNRKCFERVFTVQVLHGKFSEEFVYDGIIVSQDSVNDVGELENTNLHYTPIIICLSQDSLARLQNELNYLCRRSDVDADQLFFYKNDNNLEDAFIVRFIRDLGVEDPQIITMLNDDSVRRYLELYPLTEHIYEMLKIIQKRADDIERILEVKNSKSEIENREVYDKINNLDDVISRLKQADDLIAQKNRIDMPESWKELKDVFLRTILKWKNMRTKITREEEAKKLSVEFDEDIQEAYISFLKKLDHVVGITISSLENECKSRYLEADYDKSYETGIVYEKVMKPEQIPALNEKLMEIHEEKMITAKDELIGKLRRAFPADRAVGGTPEIVYDCQAWRKYVLSFTEPILDSIINEELESLQVFFEDIKQEYQKHITTLIQKQEEEKANICGQLSVEEQKLQKDNDWLVELYDRIREIERG